MTTLAERLQASPYLTSLCETNPDLVDYWQEKKAVDYALLQGMIDELTAMLGEALADMAQFGTQLRQHKGQFALLWSLAELSESVSFPKLGVLQSTYADASVAVALRAAWGSVVVQKAFGVPVEITAEESGLFILGLGKLGGLDLNFSSDIDLIAFYDKDRFPKPRMHGAKFVASRVLVEVTKLLSDTRAEHFVWRVDWRLRPYAGLRDLTMPTSAADDFYHYHARPWHRLALIKARVIAGDHAAGDHFLEGLRSFLWRQNLDYRAIDDIASLKSKINREHPELTNQRASGTTAMQVSSGFNVKLGYGGIREIEFIVNALQLVWGGRKLRLRQTNTLKVLAALVAEKVLPADRAAKLEAAYVFLRQAENRLQMIDNGQSYHVPAAEDMRAQFQVLHGLDEAEFDQQLRMHRAYVYQEFSHLFEESDEQADTPDEVPRDWQAVANLLDESSREIVAQWEEGFIDYGVLVDRALKLKPLAGAFTQVILKSGTEPEKAIQAIHQFLRRLPPGGQYLRLLQEFPGMIHQLIEPLLQAPAMAVLLEQSPHLIDRLLESEAYSEPQSELDDTIVFYTKDYETRLENIRRLANEELYLRYEAYLDGRLSARVLERDLTTLAENLLASSLRVVGDEMGLDAPPIAVLGMGKLGMRCMMPKSDLDLVYLFQNLDDHQLANAFAARLQTVVNVPMREGRVYELDTRLRPSGKSGSATISLDGFEADQFNRAHTWSHLALFPARFVGGDPIAGERFSSIKHKVLTRPRDQHQFLCDGMKMLNRVREQRIQDVGNDQFLAKLRPGGLMELEYLLSCLGVLEAIENPAILDFGYDDAVVQISGKQGVDLIGALHFLRSVQLEVRLFGHDEVILTDLPMPVIDHLLQTLELNTLAEVEQRMDATTQLVLQAIDRLFEPIRGVDLSDWKEESINWLK